MKKYSQDAKSRPEQDILRELFHYDEDTGDFTRKLSIQSRSMAGSVAGTISKTSDGMEYIKISINYRRYYAHRLAWLYVYGEWPNYIDHIDGNGLNNSISNLRNADPEVNAKNQRIRNDNSSGHIGVSKSRRGYWRAYINVEKKRISLGDKLTFDDAVRIRKEAEIKYGYHENHGRKLK